MPQNRQLHKEIEDIKPDVFYSHCHVRSDNTSREKLDVDGEELWVRYFEWVITNDAVDSYYTYQDEKTSLPNYAKQAAAGVPILKNHDYRELNMGKSTTGVFNLKTNEVTSKGYIQEGLDDVGSDDVIKRILAGTTTDVSIGFRGDEVCTECGDKVHWFWGDCDNGHYPGQVLTDDDGNERTVYGRIENGELVEYSPVWRGANPDAKVIRSVREFYKSGDLKDKHIDRLSNRFNCEFRNYISRSRSYRSTSKPKSKSTKPVLFHRTNEESNNA